MTKFILGFLSLSLSLLVSAQELTAEQKVQALKLKYINPLTTSFGHEASFQNEAMLSDGPLTMKTPEKLAAFNQMTAALGSLPWSTPLQLVKDETNKQHKPSKTFSIGKEQVNVMMEPGCLEVTLTPKLAYQLKDAWTPIYQAADNAQVAPYLLPVGRGGGGGQFHIGGTEPSENPFLKHPLLLRNLFVFMHVHPGFLFPFAEGFDVGDSGNARTHHTKNQDKFLRAIAEFDKWYLEGGNNKSSHKVVAKFVEIISASGIEITHYGAINLDHFVKYVRNFFGFGQNKEKFTVELRNFRPMPAPEYIESVGLMLLKTMDYLAQPDFLLKNRKFERAEFNTMFSSFIVENDWRQVKKIVGLSDPLLDELVEEYTRNSNLEAKEIAGGIILRQTYSEDNRAGQNYEMIKSLKAKEKFPLTLGYKETNVPMSEIKIDGQRFAVGVYAEDLKEFINKWAVQIRASVTCQKVLLVL
jgi:hypothetical protein